MDAKVAINRIDDLLNEWKEKYSRVITAAHSEVKTESPDEQFIKNNIAKVAKKAIRILMRQQKRQLLRCG